MDCFKIISYRIRCLIVTENSRDFCVSLLNTATKSTHACFNAFKSVGPWPRKRNSSQVKRTSAVQILVQPGFGLLADG